MSVRFIQIHSLEDLQVLEYLATHEQDRWELGGEVETPQIAVPVCDSCGATHGRRFDTLCAPCRINANEQYMAREVGIELGQRAPF